MIPFRMSVRAVAGAVASMALACQATTTRPTFQPVPEATRVQIELLVPEATERLGEALTADSIPLERVTPRDGYVESRWFTIPELTPVTGRPLGPPTNKVRAWVDPGRPGHSWITAEMVYRLAADPSRDPREFERHVHTTHTARVRVLQVLRKLLVQYGHADDLDQLDAALRIATLQAEPAAVDSGEVPAAPPDTGVRPARPDTTPQSLPLRFR